MARKFNASAPDFAAHLTALLRAREEDTGAEIAGAVATILHDVRTRGNDAVIEYTKRFDRVSLTPETLKLSQDRWLEAANQCPKEVVDALTLASARIREFHLRQMPAQAEDFTDDTGIRMGWRWTAVDAAGLYVPGGRAAYPSTVLMNAIPARVAGVERLAMVVPTPDNVLNPAVMAAALIAKISEIYCIGGVQAVGALAYGTETIAPVDVIAGPGNAYVAEAKRQLFGRVGIDMIAGPSEVCIVADAACDPAIIAVDLLAQAEHDPLAQSILITDDATFAARVEAAVQTALETLPRAAIARESWERFGAIILVDSVMNAGPIIDRIAPEHLELAIQEPAKLVPKFRHAGAIFLGHHTPEALGDYLAGPSHVLPTSGTARFASGLSVLTFMKRSSVIMAGRVGLRAIGPAAVTLAHTEGLDAHAGSVSVRLQHADKTP